MTRIPTQASCDTSKPEEAMLWALMYVPVVGRNPMVLPRNLGEHISTHLTECGFVHVDQIKALADENGMIRVEDLPEQKKKLVRPYRGQQSTYNPLGRYAPMDEVEEDPVIIQDPVSMTVHEREAQVERLRYMGYRINEPVPEPVKARLADPLDDTPEFDPEPRSVTEVNTYLRDIPGTDEYIRVVRAEKRGRARQGILKRHND